MKKSGSKAFVEHLEDLRSVVLRSLVAIVLTTIASFFASGHLFHILMIPYEKALAAGGHSVPVQGLLLFQSLMPSDTFVMSMRLALTTGVILAFPYIMGQVWRFVSPGLLPHEKKWIVPLFVIGGVFFILGSLLAYFVIVPTAINFFRSYSLNLGITPVWTISHYVSFVTTLLLVFGITFELPVVLVLLVTIGILSAKTLASVRKYAILAIFVASAVLTPPDVVSMLLLSLPLILLYELSITASRVVEKFQLSKGGLKWAK